MADGGRKRRTDEIESKGIEGEMTEECAVNVTAGRGELQQISGRRFQ